MRIRAPKFRFFYAPVFVLLLLLTPQCTDKYEDYVPYVPVSLNINLDIRNELKIPGNSIYIKEYGYGGIIVYCEILDFMTPANSIYHAYDATCTNEVSTECIVEIEDNPVFASCPCCQNRYSLLDGRLQKGTAKWPLKQYVVRVVNNTLRITNL